MSGCGGDVEANDLLDTLSNEVDFQINLPDLTTPNYQIPALPTELTESVKQLKNEDITTKEIGGSGTFDYFMDGFKAHLQGEFEAGRITGEQYTKAYIALTEGAMGNATQFLLGRDQSYWQAVNAQLQAQNTATMLATTRIQLEMAKVQLKTTVFEAHNARANFALTKMRLATENIQYCISKFNLEEMMPTQKDLLLQQVAQAGREILSIEARTEQTKEETKGLVNTNALQPLRQSLLEKQISNQTAETANVVKQGILLDNEASMQAQKVDMLAKQILGQTAQNLLIGKQADNMAQEILLGPQKLALLMRQVANQEAQTNYVIKQTTAIDKDIELQPYKKTLLQEQAEAQRAQTADNRTDGAPISGSLGQQKALYAQQIISYKRDAEMKAVKVFVDAWVTMKSLDEGLAPPTAFSNANLDVVLATMKANNGL